MVNRQRYAVTIERYDLNNKEITYFVRSTCLVEAMQHVINLPEVRDDEFIIGIRAHEDNDTKVPKE